MTIAPNFPPRSRQSEVRKIRNPHPNVLHPDAAVCPVRVVTYAWGEHYVDTLLSITLPAVLASGNLPYVASVTSCEVVILTEEIFFPEVDAAAAVKKIREICPVHLVGIDDLVSRPDKYGMALTYVLHRGCEALDAPVTETWFLFLNADFVLANNSWRRLIPQLACGTRIVTSPSYCVNAHEVAPKLRELIDPATSSLQLSPRAMAALAIDHRHDTIRAKTLNDGRIQTRYMDQFYWKVDDSTFLGCQMPVAVVGMWPEHRIGEPNTYWDYGLIKEYCPSSETAVIGDSDDFLMVELREKNVASSVMVPAKMQPFEIAEPMVSWVTDYQRQFAEHPLTLHSSDLPPNIEDDRAKLHSHVSEILSYCPRFLPSHVGHPQWEYHFVGFTEGRHNYLSKRLGMQTDRDPCPSLSQVDLAWWQYDGLRKRYAHERSLLERSAQMAVDSVTKRIQERLPALDRQDEMQGHDVDKWLIDLKNRNSSSQNLFASLSIPAKSKDHILDYDGLAALSTTLDRHARHFIEHQGQIMQLEAALRDAIALLDGYFRTRVRELDLTYKPKLTALERAYDQHLQREKALADIPDVGIYCDGSENGRGTRTRTPEAARRGFPLFQRRMAINPYWAALRHLRRIVADAGFRGSRNFLTIGSRANLIHGLADYLPGVHASVSVEGALSPNFCKFFDPKLKFDVCICDLTPAGFQVLKKITDAVKPIMSAGGTIAALEFNSDPHVRADDFGFVTPQSIRLYHARSSVIFRVLRFFFICARVFGLGRLYRSALIWILENVPNAKKTSLARRARRVLSSFWRTSSGPAPILAAVAIDADVRDPGTGRPFPWTSLTVEFRVEHQDISPLRAPAVS